MKSKLKLYWALPLMAGVVGCTHAEFKPRAAGNVDFSVAPTNQLLADAKMQFRLGNFALAIDKFRKAIRQSPDSVDAHNGLAASYDRLGRFDLSRRYYEEALALAPRDPKVRHNFAVSLRMQGLADDALAFEAETANALRLASSGAGSPIAEQQLPAETASGAPSKSITIRLPPPVASIANVPTAPQRPAKLATAPREVVAPRKISAGVKHEGLQRRSLSEVELITEPIARPVGRVITARIQDVPPQLVSKPSVERAAVSPGPAAPVMRQVSATQWEPLRVMNAVGRRGQAGRMRSYLGGKGWDRVAVGDAAVLRAKSVILYPAGSEAYARKLADQLPFKTPLLLSPKATRVVLLLGRNSALFDNRLRSGGKKV